MMANDREAETEAAIAAGAAGFLLAKALEHVREEFG